MRDCLRWEFGFSCAFCLLHEADLTELGAKGTGLTWIEHKERRAEHPELANDYSNCFFCCRFCNRARGVAPAVDHQGRQLLDPCQTPWADRFVCDDGRLRCHDGDSDASYTHGTYDFDDERRVWMRNMRRRTIATAIEAIVGIPERLERFLAIRSKVPASERGGIDDEIHDLRRRGDDAWAILRRFQSVPADAPVSCRCNEGTNRRLPAWLEAQTIEIAVPVA